MIRRSLLGGLLWHPLHPQGAVVPGFPDLVPSGNLLHQSKAKSDGVGADVRPRPT